MEFTSTRGGRMDAALSEEWMPLQTTPGCARVGHTNFIPSLPLLGDLLLRFPPSGSVKEIVLVKDLCVDKPGWMRRLLRKSVKERYIKEVEAVCA